MNEFNSVIILFGNLLLGVWTISATYYILSIPILIAILTPILLIVRSSMGKR